jgi:hypothetical protein
MAEKVQQWVRFAFGLDLRPDAYAGTIAAILGLVILLLALANLLMLAVRDSFAPLSSPSSPHGRSAAGHREDEGATADNGKRIDFCFVSAALAGRVQAARIDANASGSDHQPLWVDMDL